MADKDAWMKMTKGGSRVSEYSETEAERKKREAEAAKKNLQGKINSRKQQMDRQETGSPGLTIRGK